MSESNTHDENIASLGTQLKLIQAQKNAIEQKLTELETLHESCGEGNIVDTEELKNLREHVENLIKRDEEHQAKAIEFQNEIAELQEAIKQAEEKLNEEHSDTSIFDTSIVNIAGQGGNLKQLVELAKQIATVDVDQGKLKNIAEVLNTGTNTGKTMVQNEGTFEDRTFAEVLAVSSITPDCILNVSAA